MMKEMLWQLFKSTGIINYYVLMKELENGEKHENRKGKRDCI